MAPYKDGSIVPFAYSRLDGYPQVILMAMYYSSLLDGYVFATYASSRKMAALAADPNVTVNYGSMYSYRDLTYIHAQALPLDRAAHEDVYRDLYARHSLVFDQRFEGPDDPEYQLLRLDVREACRVDPATAEETCAAQGAPPARQ